MAIHKLQFRVLFFLVTLTLWAEVSLCIEQNDLTNQTTTQKSEIKSVPAYYLYLDTDSETLSKTIELGNVPSESRILVDLKIRNGSPLPVQFDMTNSDMQDIQLASQPIAVEAGQDGHVQLLVNLPDLVHGEGGTVEGIATVGSTRAFHMHFKYKRTRNIAFNQSVHTVVIKKTDGESLKDNALFEIPITLSDVKLLNQSKLEWDKSLSGFEFTLVKKGNGGVILAKPLNTTRRLKSTGLLRLIVDGKAVSETRLIVKQGGELDLVPDYLSLKLDPQSKKYCGEMIIRSEGNAFPIDSIQISAEHIDDVPVTVVQGKMSDSAMRVYVKIDGKEKLSDNDLILFTIASPLQESEVLLRTVIFK